MITRGGNRKAISSDDENRLTTPVDVIKARNW